MILFFVNYLIATVIIFALFIFFLLVYIGLRRRSDNVALPFRKKLEDLEAGLAKNRAFIAALPDQVCIINHEGRYLECNDADINQAAGL